MTLPGRRVKHDNTCDNSISDVAWLVDTRTRKEKPNRDSFFCHQCEQHNIKATQREYTLIITFCISHTWYTQMRNLGRWIEMTYWSTTTSTWHKTSFLVVYLSILHCALQTKSLGKPKHKCTSTLDGMRTPRLETDMNNQLGSCNRITAHRLVLGKLERAHSRCTPLVAKGTGSLSLTNWTVIQQGLLELSCFETDIAD